MHVVYMSAHMYLHIYLLNGRTQADSSLTVQTAMGADVIVGEVRHLLVKPHWKRQVNGYGSGRHSWRSPTPTRQAYWIKPKKMAMEADAIDEDVELHNGKSELGVPNRPTDRASEKRL